MNIKLPGPRERLADCIWLPRILAKARLLARNELPPEYAERFCHPSGTDNQFLVHLGLTREDIIALAELPENQVIEVFLQKLGGDKNRIQKWNHIAVNLGRRGYPLEERLPVALSTTYKHLAADSHKFSTVFEVLEADEGITTNGK